MNTSTVHEQLRAITKDRNEVCADYIRVVSDLDAANAEIAHAAIEINHMRGCIEEALTMAENLRKATGDVIPAGICHSLRAALAGPILARAAATPESDGDK